MKRLHFLGVGCLALSGAAIPQIKLNVTASGLPATEASYFHKLLADGSKQVQISMTIQAASGRKVRVRTERTYAADGKPIRAFVETIAEKPAARKQATVTFDSAGARVVLDEGGKRTVREAALAETAPRECVPEFWFLRDKPAVGASAKYYAFDLNKLEWALTETTYKGVVQLRWNGRTVRAHHMRSRDGESWLDDAGLPYRIQGSAATMERVGT